MKDTETLHCERDDMVGNEANATQAVHHSRWFGFSPDMIELPISELADLLEISRDVNDAAGQQEPDSNVGLAMKRLNAWTSRVFVSRMVDLCERNGGPGRALPEPLKCSLTHYLDQTVDRSALFPGELNECHYLRWLAHLTVDSDQSAVDEFHSRWAARQWLLSAE